MSNKILEEYSIGKIKSIKRITKGYSNNKYKINTTKGIFLLKIFKEKSAKELQYEIKVLHELSKINFPFARAILRKDRKSISKIKSKYAIVYEFISGKEPKINKKTLKEIATTLAQLHKIKKVKKLQKKCFANIDLCKKLVLKFKTAKNQFPEIFTYFKEETNFLSKPLKEKIPRGLIYFDWCPDNTLFKQNKLIAVLDFEETCTDNFLADIGMAINGFCFKNNKLNFNLLNAFLKEYNKKRQLSKKEKKLLYYYIQWGAHANIYWHLARLINKKENKKLKRVFELIKHIKEVRKIPLHKFNKMIFR